MMRVDYGVSQSKDSALRMSGHNIAGGIGAGMNLQSQDNFQDS